MRARKRNKAREKKREEGSKTSLECVVKARDTQASPDDGDGDEIRIEGARQEEV